MSDTLSRSGGRYQPVASALAQAKATGRPVPITNPDGSQSTLVALPNGNLNNASGYGGFGGSTFTNPDTLQSFSPTPGSNALTASGPGYGANTQIPTVVVPRVQAPLNQANPQTTYVSPVTAQPATAAPVAGQTDTQSGPPVHATYDYPQPATAVPDVVVTAKRYRQAHGLATDADNSADALNAQSLAAAQAGRTYLQPGPYPAGGNVIANALIMPPAQLQQPGTQVANANNLLQQQQQAASG